MGETLGLFSVERFVSRDDIDDILSRMERHKATLPPNLLSATRRTNSVHSVDGLSLEATMSAYEPAGRVEIEPLPEEVVAVLECALDRAKQAVMRVFPSASRGGEWIYIEYGPGQFITPHVDYALESLPTAGDGPAGGLFDHSDVHVSGLSIALTDDYTGGEFFVETSAAPELWRRDRPHLVAGGADHTSDWFPRTARTRWTTRPTAGTLLLYGSQLVHGTLPVTRGVARKIIGFLKP